MKLFLIGALSVVSLVLGGLTAATVLPADDRSSVVVQYFLVGAILAALFWVLGGFGSVKVRYRSAERSQGAGGSVEARQQENDESSTRPDRLDTDVRVLSRTVVGPGNMDTSQPTREAPIESVGRVVDKTVIAGSSDSERLQEDSLVPFGWSGGEALMRRDLALQISVLVRQHEEQLVDRLIREGLLTTEGPITDRDVRAMVWVAVSSIELADTMLHGFVDESAPELRATPQLGSPSVGSPNDQ